MKKLFMIRRILKKEIRDNLLGIKKEIKLFKKLIKKKIAK